MCESTTTTTGYLRNHSGHASGILYWSIFWDGSLRISASYCTYPFWHLLFVVLITSIIFYFISFLFDVFALFLVLWLSLWSFVHAPLIFSCPVDHVPDWQPRGFLGMVEARSVDVKKHTRTHTQNLCIQYN